MKYKRLGNTDIYPSQIVMGTAQWKDDTFLEPFHLSFEMGVNYIDTSPWVPRRKSGKKLQEM